MAAIQEMTVPGWAPGGPCRDSGQGDPVGRRAAWEVAGLLGAVDEAFGDQGAEDASGDVIVIEWSNFVEPAAAGLVHAIGDGVEKGLLFVGEADVHVCLVLCGLFDLLI